MNLLQPDGVASVELIGTPSMIIDAITLIIMNVAGSNATIISKYQHHAQPKLFTSEPTWNSDNK